MPQFYQDSIFWVELDKIHPNPYQPRKEFDEGELQSLADSIRQYGVLQALVVTRNEQEKEDGGLAVHYELISGERRLRAAKLAGVKQVPVIIRTGEESQQMKLELAIIENVQREDLNPVDRARAFQRLIDDFGFSHGQVAKKVGKSREYITNNLRVLSLPQEILDDLSSGKLAEGHARPLMMLNDRPEEQQTLYKEIVYKKMSVREAERVARKIAKDKQRKRDPQEDPKTAALEQEFAASLGTRVHIERREQGGKLSIDFFSDEDLQQLLEIFKQHGHAESPNEMMERFIANKQREQQAGGEEHVSAHAVSPEEEAPVAEAAAHEQVPEDSAQEIADASNDAYTVGAEHVPETPASATEAHQEDGSSSAMADAHESLSRTYAQPGERMASPSEQPASTPDEAHTATPASYEEQAPETKEGSAEGGEFSAAELSDEERRLLEQYRRGQLSAGSSMESEQSATESAAQTDAVQQDSGEEVYWSVNDAADGSSNQETNAAVQKETESGSEQAHHNSGEPQPSDDDELYSIRNFTI